MRLRNILPLVILCFSSILTAQNETNDTLPLLWDIPEITILESRDGLFARTPGSVSYINQAGINRIAPVSGNEVFKTLPGIHVVDEEGAGLRLNLSVRGLDPDRSRGILVLEDGIPVALAPYGEPEMYYTPAIDRMAGIELLKGSGQILYGPQTIGGVLNYITADPPASPEGYVKLQAGAGGMVHAQAGYGATVGSTGYQLNYLHKRADKLAYAGYRINDLTGKFRFFINRHSHLNLKVSVYDEWSDATYIGLTQGMYDSGNQDFTQMAPDDQLSIRRYATSLSHVWQPDSGTQLKTVLFGYTTTRDWQRQDFSSNASASNQTGVIWGDPAIPGGAVFMLNRTSHRNRQFEVAGLESRLSKKHTLFGPGQQLDLGTRILYERAFEQRVNGTTSDAPSGALIEDERRTGYAWSTFLQNQWSITSRIHLTAGLRSEVFLYDREIFRGSFGGTVKDTMIEAGRDILTFIPGIGMNYEVAPNWTFFAGLHKGFAPPRIKDAITQAGDALDLAAEESWNSELGIRHKRQSFWGMEATAFFMDFTNQIIPVSESSGGTGSGLVNGGATRHLGIELGLDLHFGEWMGPRHQLDLHTATTVINAYYNKDRFLTFGSETINIKGNKTPYAPGFYQSATLSYMYRGTWGATAHVLHTGHQFTDELNTKIASADGRTGEISGYTVLDLNVFHQLTCIPLKLGVSVKNLTDERYIITRRPQGIRVGLPRYFSGSIEFRF